MCGIVGIASAFNNGFSKAEMDLFHDMLFLDTLRGFDSTGVFGVNKTANVEILKEASHGLDFIRTKEFGDFSKNMTREGVFVVGHNRAATRGTIKDENAHPFWVNDNTVLVQNGTYKGSHEHLAKTEVDTEAVAITLDAAETIEEGLQKINAAYTLVWYSVADKSLYLIRNDERPLWYVHTMSGGLVWASERETILYAASRGLMNLRDKVQSLEPMTLIQLKMASNGTWAKTETKLLNAKYKPPFLVQQKPTKEEWDDALNGPFSGISGTTRAVIPFPSPSTSPDDIKGSLGDILLDRYPETHVTQEEAKEARETMTKLMNSRQAGCRFIIDNLDYLPANKHQSCQTWHIFGNLLLADPDADKVEPIVVHWFVFNMSEKETMEYCAAGLYKASVTTVIERRLNSNANSPFVVTAFASSPVLFQPPKPNMEPSVASLH